MLIIGILLIVGTIILICANYYAKYSNQQLLTKQEYEKLLSAYQSLRVQIQGLQHDYDNNVEKIKDSHNTIKFLNQEIENNKTRLQDLQESYTISLNTAKNTADAAFENYHAVLENKYVEVEKEYDALTNALSTAYSNKQQTYLKEMSKQEEELELLRSTVVAARQAQLREQEKKENLSFYCLKITDTDLNDINYLNSIKTKLNNKDVLNKLIWSTFFLKETNSLCNRVLGTGVKCGIYKITNKDYINECYIGQSVNISERFKQHIKAGLGIDNNGTNKLYKAMQQNGVWNYTFELLEECPRNLLNEKEKFYIELYESDKVGLNVTKGTG